MRNSQRHCVVLVLVLGLSFVLLDHFVLCRWVPYSSDCAEVELDDLHKATTNARMVNMRRLHTDVRPAPLGYPPPPTVTEPPTESPAPSPDA